MTYRPGYMPYVEPPTLAECQADEQVTSRPDPNAGRLCMTDPNWAVHTTEAAWLACPRCQGRAA